LLVDADYEQPDDGRYCTQEADRHDVGEETAVNIAFYVKRV